MKKEHKKNREFEFFETGWTGAYYKKRAGAVESLHPAVLLIYFVGLAAVTMITLNPVLLGISFAGAVLCTGTFIGMRKLLGSLAYAAPVLLLLAILNPMFVHKGESILFFLNDNPVTKEAVIYGFFAALMIVTVFYWFKCFSIVMTSDKIVYIFGKAAPRLALTVAMTLGFIPKLKRQYKKISGVQKAMGMYTSKSVADRLWSRFRVMSALAGWALEISIETADSINARGYGLKKRTSYANYSWTKRSIALIVFILTIAAVLILGLVFGAKINYYPAFDGIPLGLWDIVAYTGISLLALTAGVLEIQENIKWRLLISKI